MHVYIRMCMYMNRYMCVGVCIHTHTHTHTHTYIYIYIYIYMHRYIYKSSIIDIELFI